MNISDVFQNKISLYFDNYILPSFNPEKIHWIFSLSGGKDSFAMAEGIRDWYLSKSLMLTATGLYINQWNDPFLEHFRLFLPWLEMEVVEASHDSHHLSRFQGSRQAACRQCSDIRRQHTDSFLKQHRTNGLVNIVCRGLHLSDMSISILWRMIMGISPIEDMMRQKKGRPLTELFGGHYLAKPLCFVREFECQQYSMEKGYQAVHCSCPGLRYPSRRDIVEESARLFYTGDLWEFDIPYVTDFFKNVLDHDDISEIIRLSAHGIEEKRNLIPEEFYDFAHRHFARIAHYCDNFHPIDLELIINNFFTIGEKTEFFASECFSSVGLPQLLETDFTMRMIATLGPYWAAICLTDQARTKCFDLQQERFDYSPDILWSQVIALLSLYYKSVS